MVEYWSAIHIVVQDRHSFVFVYRLKLSKEVELLTLLLQFQITVRPHMTCALILSLLLKFFTVRLSVTIIKSFQPRSHPKVINKERMLINVLKHTELTTIA